jgi:thymidylate synthase
MIATTDVRALDLTEAWLKYVALALEAPKHEVFHAVVRVAKPIVESDKARRAIEKFMSEWAEKDDTVLPIRTVRSTIFPRNYALRSGTPQDLAETYRADYKKIRDSDSANLYGTYFGRLVQADSSLDGTTYDQLNDTIAKLSGRNSNGTRHEIDLRFETDSDAPALGIYQTKQNHKRTLGFPCMSHMSFQRDGGTLHIAAMYRNQDIGRKAYGNMQGLGELCDYVSRHSHLETGSLTLLAGRAYLKAPMALLKRHLPKIESAYRHSQDIGQESA